MENLILIQSTNFGSVQCDFWMNESREVFMTILQLAFALGYESKNGIEVLLNRNSYIRGNQFSGTYKMKAPDGKFYDTRVFTEDGIYEITFLSGTEKAKEFRSWVRKILKSLRGGKLEIKSKSAALVTAEARLLKEKTAAANAIFQTAKDLKDVIPAGYLMQLVNTGAGILTEKPIHEHQDRILSPEIQREVYKLVKVYRDLEDQGLPVDRDWILSQTEEYYKTNPRMLNTYAIIRYAADHYERLKRCQDVH